MKNRQLRITSHRFGFGVLVSGLLLLVASMTSCSKENDPNRLPDGEYPMTFTASVAEETATRTITEESILNHKNIGLYLGGIDVRQYAYNKGKIEAAYGVTPWYWTDVKEEKTITAWCPLTKEDIDGQKQPTSFTVKVDQRKSIDYENSDMLYISKEKITFAERNKNISFRHLPAKVVINLKKGDGVSEEELKSATVTIENQVITGNIDGDWNVTSGTGSESIKPREISTDSKRTVEAILVPQQMQGKKFIKIAIGTKNYFYTPKNDTDGKLESGRLHEYDITLRPAGITVTGNGITEWTGSDDNISGEVPMLGENNLKVGDYYYSDGSWSDGGYRKYADGKTELLTVKPIPGRNVIGIVYWTGNATSKDSTLKANHSNCTRGLVVSLREFNNVVWQRNSKNVQDWLNINHKGRFLPLATNKNEGGPLHNIQGYNNTKAIESFNNTSTNGNNFVGIVETVVDYRRVVPAPSTSSDWYVPSLKELTLLCGKDVNNICIEDFGTFNRDLINKNLSLIRATPISSSYWSSSEDLGYKFAYFLNFENSLLNFDPKGTPRNVRFTLAF